jgi:hypothetical protein
MVKLIEFGHLDHLDETKDLAGKMTKLVDHLAGQRGTLGPGFQNPAAKAGQE